MKESKAVNVTKRDIRKNLLHREYQLYSNRITYQFEEPIKYARRSRDVGLQYNWRRDNVICTCKNFIGLKKQQEPQYFSTWPRQIVTSRNFTDIGVGSVKALPKKKIRRVHLPEMNETGVGSSDLSSYIVRKSRFVYDNSFYDQDRTSSKCVGGTVDTNTASFVSATVSPIDFTKSGTTSPKDPTPVYTFTNKEIGSHIVKKPKVTTTAHIGTDDIAGDEESPKMINIIKTSIFEKATVHQTKAEVTTSADKSQGDTKILQDASFSSDSLVQHVHNLENPSQDKNYKETPSIDPMENRLDKEYDNMFKIKSIEIKPQISSAGKHTSDMKTASILRRRFEALRRTLGKKNESRDDCKKNVISVDTSRSKTSQASDPSRRDASITSDPPSLEGRSYSSCTKPFDRYASKPTKVNQRGSYKKSYTGNKKEKDSNQKVMGFAMDNEYEQGVKGMFKLWGSKFNLDEPYPNEEGELNQSFELSNELPEAEEIQEKKGRKFFFFKRKNAKVKDKNKEAFKQKKGITTGRCEVSDGLSIKIGGNNAPPTKTTIKTKPAESVEEILRKSWLLKYLNNPIESRNSVQVRWNNRTYSTSSSTVLELMENVYKDTGVVFRSRSEVITDESSYYRSFTRPHVNFVQNVEAWMVPKTIIDTPTLLNDKSQKRESESIEVSISDQKWFIDKSQAFAKKIELVLLSKNFVKFHKTDSNAEFLKIDIPRGFFSDNTSSEDPREHTSDEEVYKIVEYDTFKSTSDVRKVKNQGLDTGDHDYIPKDIKVTISVKDKHHESKILDTVINRSNTHRDVVTQGSDVFIPKKCDVIGVGIITQRDPPLVVRPKPILKIYEYETDGDTESSVHSMPKKCEYAQSFLQDYYKSCAPLAIDLFSWCVSDSHIQGYSDNNSNCSYNNGDGTKSCPNIGDDYGRMRDHDLSSCQSTTSELCVTTAAAPKVGHNENFNKNAKKKKKKGDAEDDHRVLPKDSLEVFKKRQIYAKSNKSNWNCDTNSALSATTCSAAASREQNKRDAPGDKDCPKIKRDCTNKPLRPPRGEKPCKKHVSLPDCDSMNDHTAKILSDAPIPGILTIGRQKGSCEACNKKKNTTEKHAQIDGKVCEIKEAECKKFCLEEKHPHCEKTGADDCTPNRVPGMPRTHPHSIPRAEDHLYDKDPKCSNRSPPRPVKSPPNISPARSPPISPKRSPDCSPPRSPRNYNITPPRSPRQSPPRSPRSPTSSAGSGSSPVPRCCRSRTSGHGIKRGTDSGPDVERCDYGQKEEKRKKKKEEDEDNITPPRSPRQSPPRSPRSPTGSAGSGSPPVPQCCRSRTSGHDIKRGTDSGPDVERRDYGQKEGKIKNKKEDEDKCKERKEPRSPCPPMPPCCPPPAPACPPSPKLGETKKKGFFSFGNKDCPAHPTPKPCPAQPKPKPCPAQPTPKPCPAQPKPKPCPANPEPKPKAEKCSSDPKPKSPEKPKPKCPEPPKPKSSETKQDCPKMPSRQEPSPGSDNCEKCQPICPSLDCHPCCSPTKDKRPPKLSQSKPECPPKFSPPCPPKKECFDGPHPPMMTTVSHCSLSPCKDLPPPPKPPPPPPPGPKLPCSGCPTPPCYIPTEAELEAQRCRPQNKCIEKCPFSSPTPSIHSTVSNESLESTPGCPTMPPCGGPQRPVAPRSPNKPMIQQSTNRQVTPRSPNRPVAPQSANIPMTPAQNRPVRAMPPPVPKTPNPTECTSISKGVGADRGRCSQTQTPRSKLSVCDRECSSRSRVTGIHLKQKPAKKQTCASDCSAWDKLGRARFVQGNVIHINSREKITIKLRDGNPSVEEIREPNCVTVKDAHGQTLYEREDHVAGHCSQKWSETECQKERNPLLDDLYRDSKCNRISADPITINEMRSSEQTVDDDDSNESVTNLIEINFKLKLAQGDKTAEINIGNKGAVQNQMKKSQLGNTPQEVFVMKDGNNVKENDPVNTKDINIRILVKNFKGEKSKPKKKQYLPCHDDFSKKISNKFQTVSTGYDMGIDYRDEMAETERVFSIHRATVDLTTSESKTLLKASGDVLNLNSVTNNKLSVELNSGDLPPKLSYYSQSTKEMMHYESKTNNDQSKISVNKYNKESKAKSEEIDVKKSKSYTIISKQSKVNHETEQIIQEPKVTYSYENEKLETKSRELTENDQTDKEYMKSEVAFGESTTIIAKSVTSKISNPIKSAVENIYVRKSNPENTDTENDPDTSVCNDERTDLEKKTSGEPNHEENKLSTEVSNLANRTSNEHTLPSSRGSRRESGRLSRNSTLPHINTYTSEERLDLGDKTSNELTELPTSNDPTDADNTYKSSEDLSLNKKLGKVDFKDNPEPIVDQNLSAASIAKEEHEKTTEKIKGTCCRNIMKNRKNSYREEKKELLKQVFEHGETCLKRPKTKNRIQKLKEMLKAILTSDSSEPEEINAGSNELAKDITYNSIKPAFFKNSDSLNNYLVSSMPSDNSDIQAKCHTTEECNSICSAKDSDGWSLEDDKKERTGCMCTTFASRLKMKLCNDDIDAGCCCKKKSNKIDQETICDIHNGDEFFCLDYKSAELVDVETQNTRCNSTNMSFISREEYQELVSDVRDLERDSIENVADEVAAQVMEPDTLVSIQQIIRSSKTLSKQSTPIASYTKEKTNTRLGISNEDKIVFLETKSTKICEQYRNSNEKLRHRHREKHKIKPADILQLYETKKAVLEIYAEKTETEEGEHIVAKLPRFVIDTDLQINRMTENLRRNSEFRNYCKRNIVMMSFGR